MLEIIITEKKREDGSWSASRKSTVGGGLFNDPQKLLDGTDIFVANMVGDNVMKMDGSTQEVSVLIEADLTNLQMFLI